jgi:hypothetical protein
MLVIFLPLIPENDWTLSQAVCYDRGCTHLVHKGRAKHKIFGGGGGG